MGIPSRESFSDFINFVSRERPEDSIPPADWRNNTPTQDELTQFLASFLKSLDQAHAAKRELPVGVWFFEQPIFTKALKIANRRRKPQEWATYNEYASAHAKHLLTPRVYKRDGEEIKICFSPDMVNHMWTDSSFELRVADPLCEYFYKSNWKDSLELRPKLVKVQNKITSALRELIELVQEIKEDSDYFSKTHKEHLINTILTRERMIGRLDIIPSHLRNPITRNDPTAREQLLVYRFWQLHRRSGGFSSAVAAELMFIEGVAHQYDLRTVERLYAKFSDKKKATVT